MRRETLVVVGAGPKAMALAAKARVLADHGLAAPEIHVIERRAVGANWTGQHGYTNGRQPLGTAPDKDVGFPYASTCWGAPLSAAVNAGLARFSWASYLIAHGQLPDWVDRGKPSPEHRQWAQYLQWVAREAAGPTHVHDGEVERLELAGDRWLVHYRAGEVTRELTADGVMLTGPGRVKVPASIPAHPHVLTVESFWRMYDAFQSLDGARIAIVGTGETAAAVALGLVQLTGVSLTIDVVSPLGMAYSRGESFRENRVYSDPAAGNWTMLTPQHRRDFINRTDRGVFSQAASRLLDQATNLEIVAGRLSTLTVDGTDCPVLKLSYNGVENVLVADYAVLATGADQLSLLTDLTDEPTRRELARRAGLPALTQDLVEPAIGHDLALRGLIPRLYLPMLSGLAQGPGFANLSCLGRLSDRVLEPCARRSAQPSPTRSATPVYANQRFAPPAGQSS